MCANEKCGCGESCQSKAQGGCCGNSCGDRGQDGKGCCADKQGTKGCSCGETKGQKACSSGGCGGGGGCEFFGVFALICFLALAAVFLFGGKVEAQAADPAVEARIAPAARVEIAKAPAGKQAP